MTFLCSDFVLSLSGPLISPAAKERVIGLIASCEEEGGKIILDGRNVKVEGYPKGNFVAPTLLEANTSMKCYTCVFKSFSLFAT